jgi:hypothetical protein
MCAINKELNAEEKIQVHTRCLKSSFYIKFSHIIPVLVRQKKQENDFWGLCPGLNSAKMDPKIFKKNNHVAHSIPDGSPRKKIKVRCVRGTIYGVFR